VRNEAFNSRNYFDIVYTTPPASGRDHRRADIRHQGTPLPAAGLRRHDRRSAHSSPDCSTSKKDKTFFFFSEEFRLEKTPTEYNQAVPGLKERGLILQSPQGVQKNLQVNPGTGAVYQDFDFS
jgi:hypothetical protein